MNHELSKRLLEEIENADYSDKGLATIVLENIIDVDGAKEAVLGLEKLPDFSAYKFDLNEGAMTLSVYNPNEDLEGFAARHPNRTSCGGPK